MSIGYPTRPRSLPVRPASALPAGAVIAAAARSHGITSQVVNKAGLTPAEKTAAVTKVRCLEHDLFEGGRVCRQVSRERAEAVIAELNQLRVGLGWLEIDMEGRWRWPHTLTH
jgi:hypothetical protein